ncbi:MAG: GAF domain-containing protein [Betaproteobacteria bacterium]|nr:GAF domain-containing protein [Betaproteobacteria bacterium]
MARIESINQGTRRNAGTWPARLSHSRWSYYAVLALAFAAILATAALNYRAIDRELTGVALSRRAAVAQLAAATLSEKFGRLADVAVSLATRVRFRDLVASGKWSEAAEILRDVPRDLPFVERLFLADVEGTLMADTPVLPGVRGVNFSSRDWYRGVRRDWRPYISALYLRAAEPRVNVFAAAVPIKGPAGRVVGILVLQVRAETLFDWVRTIDIGPEGFAYVVDSKGQLAFHPAYPQRREIVDLSSVPAVRKLLDGAQGVETGLDPVGKADSIAGYAPVPGFRWGVVAAQPVRASRGLQARDNQLRRLLIGYGLILALCGSAIFLVSRITVERERGAALRREAAELARLNRSLKMLSECNQALVRAETEPDLLAVICDNIVRHGGYKLAWVGYAVQDGDKPIHPVARAGFDEGYVDQLRLTWSDSERGRGPTGTAIRTGSPVVSNDTMVNPAFATWRDEALKRGFASAVALSLVVESRAVGALTIYAGEPDAFHEAEVELLVELANDLAYGINALRTRAAHAAAVEALRQRETDLKDAQHLAGIGNWTWDLQTDHHAWSEEIYRIYGRDPSLPPAAYPEVQAYFTPDSWARLTAAVETAMAQGASYECDAEVVRADGTRRCIIARGMAARDAGGAVMKLHGTVQDITERKRAEGEIRALNADLERRVRERTEQLEAANKELESFSYSVSHDLRSPLRAIDGFSRILTEDYGGRLDDEGRRLLGVVRDGSRKMGQLIDDLLAFSRLGRKPLSTTAIDMKRLVQEVLGELQASGGRPPCLVLGALPPAHGDATLVKQAWANLLGNAIKFSSKRDEPVIEVSGHENGAEVVYCVKDNGAGFDMQYYNKLFGVFQRLHGTDEFEGTGVGLAIVQRVIGRHSGRVWADGKVNEGAAFYFSLPKGGRDERL